MTLSKAKHVLFVNKTQFGYHTDYIKYCEYLRSEYMITFISFDSEKEKINLGGVNTIYISAKGNYFIRGVRFFFYVFYHVIKTSGIVFLHYFDYCFILKVLLPWKKMVLDIRTLTIDTDIKVRQKGDIRIRKSLQYFDHVTVISRGVRDRIGLTKFNSSILPLGADSLSNTKKRFSDQINLLYVGTFHARNIQNTILGLSLFRHSFPNFNVTYDIVGYGSVNDVELIRNTIIEQDLEEVVFFHGLIPYSKLTPFFDKCNVGVSYVPITDYFDCQPVTKTYEYILSGIPCIATNTKENALIINDLNGVLCDDSVESFSKSIKMIVDRFKDYDTDIIRNTLLDYTWKNIVDSYLLNVLKQFFR